MKNILKNSNENYIILYLLYFVLIISIFVASSTGNHKVFLWLFFVGSFLIFLVRPLYIVFLTVVFLPTNGIIEKEHFIFDALGILQILSFFASIYLIRVKTDFFQIRLPKKYLASIRNIVILLIIYFIYSYFKNATYSIGETYNYEIAILKSLNVIVIYLPLLLLILKIKNPKVRHIVEIGILVGIFNMALFTFLSPSLPELGIKSIGTVFTENYNERFSGVISNGDANSLGVFFVLSIAYMFFNINRYNNKILIYILITFSFIGVALTNSRTAFVSLITIFLIFMVLRYATKNKIKILILSLIAVALTFPFWDVLIDRLLLSGLQLDTSTSTNRIGKWILYFNFFINNPLTFLRGADKELLIGWGNTFYSAHNFYIQMIYNAGLIFVILFSIIYFRILYLSRKLNMVKPFLLIFIPFLFITSFVSDIGIIFYTMIFLGLIVISLNDNNSFDDKTKRYA